MSRFYSQSDRHRTVIDWITRTRKRFCMWQSDQNLQDKERLFFMQRKYWIKWKVSQFQVKCSVYTFEIFPTFANTILAKKLRRRLKKKKKKKKMQVTTSVSHWSQVKQPAVCGEWNMGIYPPVLRIRNRLVSLNNGIVRLCSTKSFPHRHLYEAPIPPKPPDKFN